VANISKIIAELADKEFLTNVLDAYVNEESSFGNVIQEVDRTSKDQELLDWLLDKAVSDPDTKKKIIKDLKHAAPFFRAGDHAVQLVYLWFEAPEFRNAFFQGIHEAEEVDSAHTLAILQDSWQKYGSSLDLFNAVGMVINTNPLYGFNFRSPLLLATLDFLKEDENFITAFLKDFVPANLSSPSQSVRYKVSEFVDNELAEKYVNLQIRLNYSNYHDIKDNARNFPGIKKYLELFPKDELEKSLIWSLREKPVSTWLAPKFVKRVSPESLIKYYESNPGIRAGFKKGFTSFPKAFQNYPESFIKYFTDKGIIEEIITDALSDSPGLLSSLPYNVDKSLQLRAVQKTLPQLIKHMNNRDLIFTRDFPDFIAKSLVWNDDFMDVVESKLTEQASLLKLHPIFRNAFDDGLFDEPFHKSPVVKDEVYPDDMPSELYGLIKELEKADNNFLSLQDLKSKDFMQYPVIKQLYSKFQKNKGLTLENAVNYEYKKTELPESHDRDIDDFRAAVKTKSVMKHTTWNSSLQRIFHGATNHIAILTLPEHLIPLYIQAQTVDEEGEKERALYNLDPSFIEENKRLKIDDHPYIDKHLTLGWVRYTLMRDVTENAQDKRVWIDEIQTDFSMLFGKEFSKEIYPSDHLPTILLKRFIKFIRSRGFKEIIIPDLTTAQHHYNRTGVIHKSVYTTLPKKLRFKKEEVSDTGQEDLEGRKLWVLAKKKLFPGYTFDW